jgi:hypothetical protein
MHGAPVGDRVGREVMVSRRVHGGRELSQRDSMDQSRMAVARGLPRVVAMKHQKRVTIPLTTEC